MNWESWVIVISSVVSLICRIGIVCLEAETEKSVEMNREQRRHPNGHVSAQKFKRVNVKGRQKQGRGRAVRGW